MGHFQENNNYEQAKKRVDDERGFYMHLSIYIIMNVFILFININNQGVKDWSQWHLYISPIIWGIGLLFHGLKIFNRNFIFGKNWEEKKIKKLMEDDDTLDTL